MENNLYLKLEKCEFEKQWMEYLGYIISPDKIEMDPAKLNGIAQWPIPKSTKEVREFMGFTTITIENSSTTSLTLLDHLMPYSLETNHSYGTKKLKTHSFI